MNDLAKRIYENQEEYNKLFLELTSKFKDDNNSSLFESTRATEIDNLLKSINVVRNNLEVLKGVEAYLEEQEKRMYNHG